MKPLFIIEHLEPEVFAWCRIEYAHLSRIVGRKNLWFTKIKHEADRNKLSSLGKVFSPSVKDLGLKNACVLDPAAPQTLTPAEAQRFQYFIFGGILGDYPPKQRTQRELTPLLPRANVRNIGKEQMSTDNAVLVVSEIIKGKRLSSLCFQDSVEIVIDAVSSVQLPYRYCLIKGKPFMSAALMRYLKKKKGV